MSRVVQTRQAIADQDEIWDYIAQDNPSAADDFLDRLLGTARLIAGQPLMGAGGSTSLRSCIPFRLASI